MSKVLIYEENTQTKPLIALLSTTLQSWNVINVNENPVRGLRHIQELVFVTNCTTFGINANMLRLLSYLETRLNQETVVRVVLLSEEGTTEKSSSYTQFFSLWARKARVVYKNILWISQSLILEKELTFFARKKILHAWNSFLSREESIAITFLPLMWYGRFVNDLVHERAKENGVEERLEETDKYFVYLSKKENEKVS